MGESCLLSSRNEIIKCESEDTNNLIVNVSFYLISRDRVSGLKLKPRKKNLEMIDEAVNYTLICIIIVIREYTCETNKYLYDGMSSETETDAR